MKNHALLYIAFAFLLSGGMVSCNTGSDPEETCDFPPGNREFTWQVDTVAWFPSTLGGVWAFADDDAYLMGSIYQFDSTRKFVGFLGLHWDGNKWTGDGIPIPEIKHNALDVIGDDFFMVSVGYWDKSDEKAGLAEYNNRTKEWKGYQFETKGSIRQVWTDGEGFFIAVGDNGMVYTKDGYQAEWVYTKAPTEFNFSKIHGITKNEIYIKGYLSVPGTYTYAQVWKFTGENWYRLFDNQNNEESIVYLEGAMHPIDGSIVDVAAYRCPVTDSLQLYVVGHQSFLLESAGQSLDFEVTNLWDKGLPFGKNDVSGIWVDLFSPRDIWFYGERYHFYHWNGEDFQAMEIPGLPHRQFQQGGVQNMVKTKSGKVFLPAEVSSQVYVVAQGVPK